MFWVTFSPVGSAVQKDEITRVDLRPSEGGLSFPRLLFALLKKRFTGRITIDQGLPHSGTRSIWLQGGMPVFTDWVSPSLRLGKILVDRKITSAAQVRHSLAAGIDDERALGQSLLADNTISPEQLAEALRIQCAEKTLLCFAEDLKFAQLDSKSSSSSPPERFRKAVNVLGLLNRGITNHYSTLRISSEMGSRLGGRIQTSSAFDQYKDYFGFREPEFVFLDFCQKGGELKDFLNSSRFSEQRAIQIIYLLWCCQMLHASEAPANKASPTPGRNPTRPPPPPAPRASSANTTKSELELALEKMEATIADNGENSFALFELPLDAGRKEVRARWAELSPQFHPDSLSPEDRPKLGPRVESVFASLSEAYGVLSNKDSRENLRATIEAGVDPNEQASGPGLTVEDLLAADSAMAEADRHLATGRIASALPLLERANTLRPDHPETESSLLWCKYKTGNQSPERAQELWNQMNKIAEQYNYCARAFYYRGMLEVRLRRNDDARKSFSAALMQDAKLIDAERQLRALNLKK